MGLKDLFNEMRNIIGTTINNTLPILVLNEGGRYYLLFIYPELYIRWMVCFPFI